MNPTIEQTIHKVLKPEPYWTIETIEICEDEKKINVVLSVKTGVVFACPICEQDAVQKGQTQRKYFRYLAMREYQVFLAIEQPILHCTTHGSQVIALPWEQTMRDCLYLPKAL